LRLIHQFSIDYQVLTFLIHESKKKYPKETGGILVGYIDKGVVRIKRAIGPGPNAIHARAKFLRDGEYCQAELDKIFEQANGTIDYLGEWHSHPLAVGPSKRDRDSIREIARDTKYVLSNPVMGLCIRQRDGWDFQCYMVTDGFPIRITQLLRST